MDAKFNINTTQNVNIELKIAGVGDRLVAIIIDMFILAGFSILFFVMFSTLSIGQNSQMIIMAVYGFIAMLYHFFMEWLFRGQTFGKRYRKIKVIHKSGTEASVFQLLVRNLIRFIDSIYGLGLLVIFFSQKSQRLGDLAAGTIVVRQNEKVNLNQTAFVDIEENYIPVYDKLSISKLESKDMEMIKEVINRTSDNMNWQLVSSLSKNLQAKASVDLKNYNNLDFLQVILKDFQYYELN